MFLRAPLNYSLSLRSSVRLADKSCINTPVRRCVSRASMLPVRLFFSECVKPAPMQTTCKPTTTCEKIMRIPQPDKMFLPGPARACRPVCSDAERCKTALCTAAAAAIVHCCVKTAERYLIHLLSLLPNPHGVANNEIERETTCRPIMWEPQRASSWAKDPVRTPRYPKSQPQTARTPPTQKSVATGEKQRAEIYIPQHPGRKMR